MSEDWLKIIKERLESYESPVPEGVWEDIEASLFPEKARKVSILPWVWGLAAAAAVALGVFIGTRLVDRSVDPTEKIEKIADGGGATSPDTIQHSSSADNGGGQSSSDSEPIHLVPAPSKSSLALAEEVYAEPDVIEVREVAEASEVSEVSESQEVPEVVEVPVTVQETAKEAIQEATQESVQEVVQEVKQDEPETVVSNGHEDEDWSKHLSADGSTRDERKPSAGISLASAGNQSREYNAFDTRPFFQGVAANFEPGTKADANIYSKTMSVPVYKEADARIIEDARVSLTLEEKDGHFSLKTNLGEVLGAQEAQMLTTQDLGEAFEPEQPFENPDGTPITFDVDYFGEKTQTVLPGPFAKPEALQDRPLV